MVKKKKTLEELLEEALVPREEQPYEVPENWIWTSLETISTYIQRGKSPKYVELSDVKVVSQKCVQWNGFDILRSRYIDESTLKTYNEERYLRKNDILWNSTGTGTIGRLVLIENELDGITVADSHVTVIRPNNNVAISNLLFRWLSSPYVQNKLNNLWSGSTNQIELNLTTVKNQRVPLPPINEQKRIVNKVERLLSKIDEAKQLIEEAEVSFQLRRAAILDKAFCGELTKKWRKENNVTESALKRLEMIKKERFQIAETKREIVEITEMFNEFNSEKCINNNDWLYVKANMFCYNISCGGTPSKDISDEGEIPFLKVYNIVKNKVAFEYKPQYIPKEVHKSKMKKSILKPNDVIMNIVGPPLKKIAIIPEEYTEMNMNQAIVRFRPIKCVMPKYLFFCLQYDETLRDVINETRGVVGQSNISISQSRNLVMPIPSFGEQAVIVRKLEELIEKEEIVLEGIIIAKKKLEILKQSILSKAFKGELGTNYPFEENAIELLKEVLEEQVK